MSDGLWVVIPCGGSGTRMGGDVPKTLLQVAGVPGIVRVVRAFRVCGARVALVVKPSERALFTATLERHGQRADIYADGGHDRQESVYHGLRALPDDAEIVLIHDGARALVTEKVIERVLGSVKACGTGVAAVPVTDTIKQADEWGHVMRTLDRGALRAVQTPQGFLFSDILRAHEAAASDKNHRHTDDASLMEATGIPVQLVEGDQRNIKLTAREDVRLAEAYLGVKRRVGIGYDAHRLVDGRALMLCGVCVPHPMGLLGHSDADVALHALMDAMLGAAALGDIGQLFPDSDERYRGISSIELLKSADRHCKAHGFVVESLDITVVAQKPKIMPFIPDMRLSIADALRIGVDQVSVKATTTEGMGFEGRGEGISAQAVVTITQSDDPCL